MIKIGVCLEMVFGDLPLEERIRRISECGFSAVEMWLPDGRDADCLRQACSAAGVTLNNIVVNPPAGGACGAPVCAEDRERFLHRVEEAIVFAQRAGADMGIVCSGKIQPDLTRGRMRANLEKTLGEAAEIARAHGFTLVLEALNTRVDHPGYYLDSAAEGFDIVRSIGSQALRLLYDVYHMQIMEGNIIATIEENIDLIGHFHAAGVPGRAEIYTGELNYRRIVKRIEAAGYKGCFGLEYKPAEDDHSASLKASLACLSDGME